MDLPAGQHRKYGQSAFGADEGECRFPRKDIKPVLSSRLINIAQTRLDMGPSLDPLRRAQWLRAKFRTPWAALGTGSKGIRSRGCLRSLDDRHGLRRRRGGAL